MNLSKESEEIWTKEKYLNDIQSLIMTYPEEKIKEVMMHYNRRFDLGIAYGKSPNEIVTYLGTPKKVVDSLSEQRISIQNNHSSNQSISLGDKDLGRLSQKNTDNYSGRSKVETIVIGIALLFLI
nr:DUF1700 domain-containing protein [Bacillus coahuilensis]